MSLRIPLGRIRAFPYLLFGETIGSYEAIGDHIFCPAARRPRPSVAACGAGEESRGPTRPAPAQRSQSDLVETVEDEADEEIDEEKSDDGKEEEKKKMKKYDGKGGSG